MTAFNLVVYERIGLANPVSKAAITEALDMTDLRPGDRTAELGCGNAALALLIAERGVEVLAVDRGEQMTKLAERKIKAVGATESVTVVQGEADAEARRRGPFRLISALGTTALTDFCGLASLIEPGGWLLWGDLFWKQKPAAQAPNVLDYDTDPGWRSRADAAGLTLIHARISDEGDWRAYVEDLRRAADDWSRENADHPNQQAIQTRAEAIAAMYSPENRASLGFVLYLFRKPE